MAFNHRVLIDSIKRNEPAMSLLMSTRDTKHIGDAFLWSHSAEGFQHWSDRYGQISPMSDADWKALESYAREAGLIP